jgi:hypothetical protein
MFQKNAADLKEPLLQDEPEGTFFPSEQRKKSKGKQLDVRKNSMAYMRKKSSQVLNQANVLADALEKEKRKPSTCMQYVQTIAMLLTASLSYIAASAWIDIIQANAADAAANLPYGVACACPGNNADPGRNPQDCLSALPVALSVERCVCMKAPGVSPQWWVGRVCTEKDSVISWVLTMGYIVFFYGMCYKMLGMLQIVTAHAMLKPNGIRVARYYAKLFELLANACGFIIAFSLLHSAKGMIDTGGPSEVLFKLIFTMGITLVCLIFKTTMKFGPEFVVNRVSSKGWSSDREARFGMLNGKLFAVWLPWIIANAWTATFQAMLTVFHENAANNLFWQSALFVAELCFFLFLFTISVYFNKWAMNKAKDKPSPPKEQELKVRTTRAKSIKNDDDLLAEGGYDSEEDDDEIKSFKAKLQLKAEVATKAASGAAQGLSGDARQLTFDGFAFVACIQFSKLSSVTLSTSGMDVSAASGLGVIAVLQTVFVSLTVIGFEAWVQKQERLLDEERESVVLRKIVQETQVGR